MSVLKREPSPQEAEFILNRKGGYRPLNLGAQVVRRSMRVYKGVWDFAVQGGAIGSLNLYDPTLDAKQPLILPPSLIIVNVLIDVLTAPTSGGAATIALTSGVGAGDLKAAAGFAGYSGLLAGVPVSAATAIKIPAATAQPGLVPALVIAAAALTAGKINVHLECVLSD